MSSDTVPVSQADRDAAADFGRAIKAISRREAEAIMRGEWDDLPRVQAFARHRLATTPAPAMPSREDVRDIIYSARSHADKVDAILSLIPASVETGWMPIETAPKDGRGIQVIDMNAEKPEAGGAWWLYDVWSAVQPIGALALGPEVFRAMTWPHPTHWRPLPDPPALSDGSKAE